MRLSSGSHPRRDNAVMRILVVEDEPKMASLLRRGLDEEGHAVDVAAPARTPSGWRGAPYDAIVLDVMLPGLTGSRCAAPSAPPGVWAPVLMLTAGTRSRTGCAGLDAGADDYLTKPFSFGELLARLRALLRRGAARPARAAGRRSALDPAPTGRGAASRIDLTAKEFSLLDTSCAAPDRC